MPQEALYADSIFFPNGHTPCARCAKNSILAYLCHKPLNKPEKGAFPPLREEAPRSDSNFLKAAKTLSLRIIP